MAGENLVIVFLFNVKRGKSDEFIDTWNEGINWLKTQHGWVDEELLQSHDDPRMFMSVQEWTNADHFKDAASNSKFQQVMETLPLQEEVTLASYSVASKAAKRMAA